MRPTRSPRPAPQAAPDPGTQPTSQRRTPRGTVSMRQVRPKVWEFAVSAAPTLHYQTVLGRLGRRRLCAAAFAAEPVQGPRGPRRRPLVAQPPRRPTPQPGHATALPATVATMALPHPCHGPTRRGHWKSLRRTARLHGPPRAERHIHRAAMLVAGSLAGAQCQRRLATNPRRGAQSPRRRHPRPARRRSPTGNPVRLSSSIAFAGTGHPPLANVSAAGLTHRVVAIKEGHHAPRPLR